MIDKEKAIWIYNKLFSIRYFEEKIGFTSIAQRQCDVFINNFVINKSRHVNFFFEEKGSLKVTFFSIWIINGNKHRNKSNLPRVSFMPCSEYN